MSVNPYRATELYGRDVIEQYRGRELYERPPHLYAVADASYKAMKRRAKDTCIVISGRGSQGPCMCVCTQRGCENIAWGLHPKVLLGVLQPGVPQPPAILGLDLQSLLPTAARARHAHATGPTAAWAGPRGFQPHITEFQ